MTGVGRRFLDVGFSQLKPLIVTEVGTMIENVLNQFPSITSPICIISEEARNKHEVINQLREVRKQVRIVEISPHKKGPSYAIWKAQNYFDMNLPTIVSYCDFSGIWSEKEFCEELLLSDGLIQTYTGFHPHMIRSTKFAYVKKDNLGRVVGIQEKMPYTKNPMNEEASSGLYGFRSGRLLLRAIRSQIERGLSLGGEFYTSLTYLPLIEENRNIRTIKMSKFFQWGTPDDLKDFNFWAKLSRRELPEGLSSSRSNAVILAAGRGSRVVNLAKTKKPLIPVFGSPLWLYSAAILRNCDERIIYISNNTDFEFQNYNPFHFRIVSSETESKSQAESALIALKKIDDVDKPVHIFACDNLILDDGPINLMNQTNTADIIVWVTRNYAAAHNNKSNFSWVKVNAKGWITKLFVKAKDLEPDALMILGNFTFRSKELAERLIKSVLMEMKDSKEEVYLDWVLELALVMGYRILPLEVKDFWAIGTEDEFKTLQYWSEVFAKEKIME